MDRFEADDVDQGVEVIEHKVLEVKVGRKKVLSILDCTQEGGGGVYHNLIMIS
jgi:hypothetical protein